MGKRPYYWIYWCRDCEGYEFFPEYIGTNYKAALNRYNKLLEYIRQREFIDEGVDPARINMDIHTPNSPLNVGQQVTSWINDDDVCWISVHLQCVNTNKFVTGMFDEAYRAEFPDAKY